MFSFGWARLEDSAQWDEFAGGSAGDGRWDGEMMQPPYWHLYLLPTENCSFAHHMSLLHHFLHTSPTWPENQREVMTFWRV